MLCFYVLIKYLCALLDTINDKSGVHGLKMCYKIAFRYDDTQIGR